MREHPAPFGRELEGNVELVIRVLVGEVESNQRERLIPIEFIARYGDEERFTAASIRSSRLSS